jgi:flavin-dependent dehydrogenase
MTLGRAGPQGVGFEVSSSASGLRIGIIGGGPSGTFSALALRKRAAETGQRVEVTIFDRRPFLEYGPRGCNMCAGVISNSLVSNLRRLGITIPRDVVQREIEGYRLVTRAGDVVLRKPAGQTIYSAYRGRGPRWADWPRERSFDAFLLRSAVAAGCEHIPDLVTDVHLGSAPRLTLASGDEPEFDAVIVACGVNSPMVKRLARLGFGYRPPRTATACQAEIPLDPGYIEDTFRDQITIFALGLPRIKFAALTPKEQHLTVTLIGESVRLDDLESFLDHPRVRAFLPAAWEMPLRFCFCFPRFPIGGAGHPATDRLAVVGDANIARYYKNGIDSAFWTGTRAGEAMLAGDRSRDDLYRRYVRPCRGQFAHDNGCGHLLFALNDLISRSPLVMAAHMSAARREQARPRSPQRLSQILWHMFTGDAPYARILRQVLNPWLHSELVGAALRQVTGRAPEAARP